LRVLEFDEQAKHFDREGEHLKPQRHPRAAGAVPPQEIPSHRQRA
jgi:hypothetical protein